MTTAARALPTSEDVHAKQIPGEPGAWVLILCEMVVFAVLFVAIGWYHYQNPELFAESQRLLNQPLGLTNTVMMIGGSVAVALAVAAAAQARFHRASRWLTIAVACGVVFGVFKVVEYGTVLHHGNSFHSNGFWMLFFAITGAHLLHVVAGAGALLLVRRRVASGLPGRRDDAYLISAGCYWHLVDLLWLILFPLFYLVN